VQGKERKSKNKDPSSPLRTMQAKKGVSLNAALNHSLQAGRGKKKLEGKKKEKKKKKKRYLTPTISKRAEKREQETK